MEKSTYNDIKKNTYFANRNVDEQTYSDYSMPRYLTPYFKETDRELNILDIGCGLGQMLKHLKDKGFQHLHGIDINEESILACNRNGLSVELVNDIRDYTIHDNLKFDRIIMSHVLEHIEKEKIIDTLIHIRKNLLKEGGVFLLMVPNAQSYTGVYWRYEDFTHNIIFTAGSSTYVLKAAGFENIEFIDPDGTMYMNPAKRAIIKFLMGYHKLKENIWNKIMQTSYHKPSPRIYTFELKVAAS